LETVGALSSPPAASDDAERAYAVADTAETKHSQPHARSSQPVSSGVRFHTVASLAIDASNSR